MKTLIGIQEDLSVLYDAVQARRIDNRTANTLANIAGKYLIAYQLDFATKVFLNSQPKSISIEATET